MDALRADDPVLDLLEAEAAEEEGEVEDDSTSAPAVATTTVSPDDDISGLWTRGSSDRLLPPSAAPEPPADPPAPNPTLAGAGEPSKEDTTTMTTARRVLKTAADMLDEADSEDESFEEQLKEYRVALKRAKMLGLQITVDDEYKPFLTEYAANIKGGAASTNGSGTATTTTSTPTGGDSTDMVWVITALGERKQVSRDEFDRDKDCLAEIKASGMVQTPSGAITDEASVLKASNRARYFPKVEINSGKRNVFKRLLGDPKPRS